MIAILFDYDGTLSDSLKAHFYACQGVAKELNLLPLTLQQFLDWYGPDWNLVYKKMGVLPNSMQKADKIWLKYYNQRKPRLFPDSIPTLKKIKLIGYKVGLVTGGSRSRVETELKRKRIHSLFDVIIYGSDVLKKDLKPSSTQIITALKRIEANPREALYVGDMPIDVIAGKKAEVMTVAVPRGFSSEETLKRVKPDFVIHSLEELTDVLNKYST